MMRTAKYDEQIHRLELVTVVPTEPPREIKVSDLKQLLFTQSYQILAFCSIQHFSWSYYVNW
jgi:hypothetical protein